MKNVFSQPLTRMHIGGMLLGALIVFGGMFWYVQSNGDVPDGPGGEGCTSQVFTTFIDEDEIGCTGDWGSWYRVSDESEERTLTGFSYVVNKTKTDQTQVQGGGNCQDVRTTVNAELDENDASVTVTVLADACQLLESRPVTDDGIFGCTDSSAVNYNPIANISDGSCEYYGGNNGCMDVRAANYNPNAQADDGSCLYPPVSLDGCTDTSAINYNPRATDDDDSCMYDVENATYGCTSPTAGNYNAAATIDDGSCEHCSLGQVLQDGTCVNECPLNFVYENGACRYISGGDTDDVTTIRCSTDGAWNKLGDDCGSEFVLSSGRPTLFVQERQDNPVCEVVGWTWSITGENANPTVGFADSADQSTQLTFGSNADTGSAKIFDRTILMSPQTLPGCNMDPVSQNVSFKLLDIDISEN